MNWELVFFVIAVVCGLFGIWFLGRRRNFFTSLMGIFWFLAVLFQQYLPRVSSFVIARGIPSVESLIGRALPDPVTDFMDLPAVKKISAVHAELCQHCGNCTRCPYLAVSLNADRVPETDASRCIGCSICVQKCFSGALYMRERTPEEARALVERGEA